MDSFDGVFPPTIDFHPASHHSAPCKWAVSLCVPDLSVDLKSESTYAACVDSVTESMR